MMTLPETDVLTSIVSRFFRVEEVTFGDPKRGFFLRYRGQLLLDSLTAYDQMAENLRPYQITPLFRSEGERQAVILVRDLPRPKGGSIWLNLIMFALTLLSVLFAGALYSYSGPAPASVLAQMQLLLRHLGDGWPFAISLLAILLAHEFGHYIVGRLRGAAVSLPYFIPFPFGVLGTMGAFIQLKGLPKNRRALFDLGIAGPLAGLAVTVPVLLYGLARSPLTTVSTDPGGLLEGNSLLYLLAKYITFGRWLPEPVGLHGFPLLLHWIAFFFVGRPIPAGGTDVLVQPVAWAGWAGLLVTFMNLIPAGQLDGGHVLYAVFGERARRMRGIIIGILFVLGFFWMGWWIWAALLFFFGRSHAEPLDGITPLDPPRKVLAVLMLIIFLLVLTPIPFIVF